MTNWNASHVVRANGYIRDVLAGKIPACLYVRQACDRQRRDLAAVKSPMWPYRFDKAKAERVCRFIERLPHIKGPKARRAENIELEPWQSFFLTTLFGWVHKAGPKKDKRRFRQGYLEVPKGNGKSALLSGVSLYGLVADGEEGAEVYSAATTRDQAGIVFKTARQMALRRAKMCQHFGVKVGMHALSVERTASTFQALSADADNIEGKNPHIAVIDELHAHRTRSVFDNIETAMGKRDQSLLVTITTAGDNRMGVCYAVRSDLIKILNRTVDDETIFGVIYTVDMKEQEGGIGADPMSEDYEGDDPFDPKTLMKANPNYNVSVDPDHLARMAAKALRNPLERPKFLTKHLDIWVNAYHAAFDMDAWRRCADDTITVDDFRGQPGWQALDLATEIDLVARVLMFRRFKQRLTATGQPALDESGAIIRVPHYTFFATHYVPKAQIDAQANPYYEAWEIDGWLKVTEGATTDFSEIKGDVMADAERHRMNNIGYDPYQAAMLAGQLQEKGLPVVKIPQTVASLSEATKHLGSCILNGDVTHCGDPVLAYCFSNVLVRKDKKDNVFPTKEKDENKIDGAIAAIMTVAMAIQPGSQVGQSFWE